MIKDDGGLSDACWAGSHYSNFGPFEGLVRELDTVSNDFVFG